MKLPPLSAPQRLVNWAALIETLLLGGVGFMLLTKAYRGVLVFYIHPRYTTLIGVCGIVLLLTAGVRMRAIFGRAPESIRLKWGRYVLLALPLLLGTLVPARPLGANVLSSTAVGGSVSPVIGILEDNATQHWDLFQWAMALSVRAEDLPGRPADVTGFVLPEPGEDERFIVARYVMTCCAADSSAVGLPVLWVDGVAPPPDTWVRVQGTLERATVEGRIAPVLRAEKVTRIEQPPNPYLYP